VLRSTLRDQNDRNIESVIKNNGQTIKRVAQGTEFTDTAIQCSDIKINQRTNSIDLEHQVLNISPPPFSNEKTGKSHYEVISQEMGVFDSQDS
jgi:hypothetical protein